MRFEFTDDSGVIRTVSGTYEECCKQKWEILGITGPYQRHPTPGDAMILTREEMMVPSGSLVKEVITKRVVTLQEALEMGVWSEEMLLSRVNEDGTLHICYVRLDNGNKEWSLDYKMNRKIIV